MRQVGAYENVGYKHGQWLDDGVWQVELQPIPAEPVPPVPWRQAAASARWHDALGAGLPHLKL